MELTGKRALITGSRRGIGAGIATALAQAGCDIGLNDVELDAEGERTLQAIRDLGRRATFTVANIGSSTDVQRLFDTFLATHEGIDILVNNAYWGDNRHFLEITEEIWDRTMDSCLKGYFLCSQRAAQEMARQGTGGSIVSIASVHAYRTFPHDTAYGVAKAAVIRMTMSMALDLAEQGIRANAIAPGWIDSRVLPPEREAERGNAEYRDKVIPWVARRRIGLPTDIAQAVLYLCSPAADYVNGACLTVDGGFVIGGTP
ncbi:MAG: SDR family oxidoreductase [Armatimonadetes bacterium]|nr:SDR family oxidoreductase [Armatimonadota bacterium]